MQNSFNQKIQSTDRIRRFKPCKDKQNKKSNNKFKKATEILDPFTKFATIGIFVTAVFGYFYTVKPKFELEHLKIQKQKLDSEFLELKVNKDKISNELVILNNKAFEQNKLINKAALGKQEAEKQLKKSVEELESKKTDILLAKQEQEKLEKNINNLITKTTLLEKNIKKLSKEKNTLIYVKKRILWDNFVNKLYGGTPFTLSTETDFEPFKLKENKIFLKKNAPYLILKKRVTELKIKSLGLMDVKTLKEFKSFVLTNLKKERHNLVYSSGTNKHGKDHNVDLFALSDKISKVISTFVKKINKKYIRKLKKTYKK